MFTSLGRDIVAAMAEVPPSAPGAVRGRLQIAIADDYPVMREGLARLIADGLTET